MILFPVNQGCNPDGLWPWLLKTLRQEDILSSRRLYSIVSSRQPERQNTLRRVKTKTKPPAGPQLGRSIVCLPRSSQVQNQKWTGSKKKRLPIRVCRHVANTPSQGDITKSALILRTRQQPRHGPITIHAGSLGVFQAYTLTRHGWGVGGESAQQGQASHSGTASLPLLLPADLLQCETQPTTMKYLHFRQTSTPPDVMTFN